MTQPNINTLKKDTKHVYISWNIMYLVLPPTINFKTGNYNLPHNDIKMLFNSLIQYPDLSRLDKVKLSDLDTELGIRSDHFKEIYKNKKKNKEFFLDLRTIASSIPNIGVKITKEDKDETPYFIIPINKFNNVYNVIVVYANNDKIPTILSATQRKSVNFMSTIDKSKKRINIFTNVSKHFCLDQNLKIRLTYLTLDYETLFYLCTKYIPCVNLMPKQKFIGNFQTH